MDESASVPHTAERHNYILQRLQQQGFVKVSALSEHLGVSEVTIRKDLRKLEGRDLLYRTHGGANPTNPFVPERPVAEKVRLHAQEKDRIGRTAAAMVKDQDSILIASGTTVAYMARHLEGRRGLTAVTSAMNVATVLAHFEGVEVLMLGGIVRPNASAVVGPYAEEQLREHVCSKLFLGVDGFDLEHGLTTTSALEAHLNQAMMAASQRTVILTDASKFGRRSFRRICCAESVDVVITDDRVDAAVVDGLEELGVEVVVA